MQCAVPQTEQLDSTELPESIGNLTFLNVLSVGDNQLTSEFPRMFLDPGRSISNLNTQHWRFREPSLPCRNAQYKNSLKTNLPGMFRPRPRVHRFTAPPTEPPQEIASKGIGAIKKWFNDNHAAAGQAGAAAASSSE